MAMVSPTSSTSKRPSSSTKLSTERGLWPAETSCTDAASRWTKLSAVSHLATSGALDQELTNLRRSVSPSTAGSGVDGASGAAGVGGGLAEGASRSGGEGALGAGG